MHAVVGLDERVSQVVDAEAREALEGLVGVEVEVVRVAVFFFFRSRSRLRKIGSFFVLSFFLSLSLFSRFLFFPPHLPHVVLGPLGELRGVVGDHLGHAGLELLFFVFFV